MKFTLLAVAALIASVAAQSPVPRERRRAFLEERALEAKVDHVIEKRQATARMSRRRETRLCPEGFEACASKVGFECVNINEDLESCGGCPGTAESVDCTALSGVSSVACTAGACIVSGCDIGFELIAADEIGPAHCDI
ncbi:hypothetical protein MNV49_006426 [Pseudohyphozyma bogoriensis]|nr:hypothetical protein MNV49_006426 [Pseudohyphozyma bogoriensis]